MGPYTLTTPILTHYQPESVPCQISCMKLGISVYTKYHEVSPGHMPKPWSHCRDMSRCSPPTQVTKKGSPEPREPPLWKSPERV